MTIEIREEPLDLVEYARVPIAFRVERIFALTVRTDGTLGFELDEHALSEPLLKDYDAEPGNHPTDWARRFDVSRWGLVSAWDGDLRVGGAIIAVDTPDLHALEGRGDLAVLWDLRVAPEMRRVGVGRELFAHAE